MNSLGLMIGIGVMKLRARGRRYVFCCKYLNMNFNYDLNSIYIENVATVMFFSLLYAYA